MHGACRCRADDMSILLEDSGGASGLARAHKHGDGILARLQFPGTFLLMHEACCCSGPALRIS
jgi:hypothetical protein